MALTTLTTRAIEHFLNRLPPRIVVVEHPSYVFFGAQYMLCSALPARWFSRDEFQDEVRGIESATKGIGEFLQDSITQVIDQVFLRDRDQRGGGTGPFDPHAAMDHISLDGGKPVREIIPGTGRVGFEEGVDQMMLG